MGFRYTSMFYVAADGARQTIEVLQIGDRTPPYWRARKERTQIEITLGVAPTMHVSHT